MIELLEKQSLSFYEDFEEKADVSIENKGAADPKTLDLYNLDGMINDVVSQEDKVKGLKYSDVEVAMEAAIQAAQENGGLLPGGLRPDEVQNLVNNPEILKLLSSPTMQKHWSAAVRRFAERDGILPDG